LISHDTLLLLRFISSFQTNKFKLVSHRKDAESAKKTILDINALNKRTLGTAIEVLIVRRGATVVISFCNICVLGVSAVH